MKQFLLSILILYSAYSSNGQDISWINRYSNNTSYLMPMKKWESGLFQPLRYGYSTKMELSSNILIFPLLPNLGCKISVGEYAGFRLASEHILSIPSVLLNTISRKGTGGLISPEFDFPFTLGFNNSIIASHPIFHSALLNLKAGFAFALRTGKIDPMATIDLPVFFPRMAHYYKGVSLRLGSGIRGEIFSNLLYDESVQAFILTRKNENFTIENTGSLMWTPGKRIRIKGGYILTYGKYPFGKLWQLWPTFDFMFGSKTK